MKITLFVLTLLISNLAFAGGSSTLSNFDPNSLFFTTTINTTSTSQNLSYNINHYGSGDMVNITITSSNGSFVPSYTNVNDIPASGTSVVGFVFVGGPTVGTVTGTASFYNNGAFISTPTSYLNVVSFTGVTLGINPSLTFNGFSMTVGGSNVDLTSLLVTNSTGAKSFSISGGTAASINGTNLVALSAGTVTILGTLAATTTYNATSVSAIVTVEPMPIFNPSITFTGATLTVGGASIDLSTLFSSNSSGAKSFGIASGTAASLSGNNLTPLSVGNLTVTGNISSVAGFNAGVQMAVFNVVAAPIVIINGINDVHQNTTLSVYPNPTDGYFVIEYNVANTAEADITCLNGKIVWKGELTEGINSIDLRLPSGMYFLQVGKKVYKISIL